MFNDYRALYEAMWGKCRTAGQATDDSIACWIPKATNSHF